MLGRLIAVLTLLCTVLAAPKAASSSATTATPTYTAMAGNGTTMDEDVPTLNMDDYMQLCNETYRVNMSYFEQLNTTGSFQDESDDIPMCYLHCVFDKAGLIDIKGAFDMKMSKVLYRTMQPDVPEVEDMVEDCIAKRDEFDLCRRTYGFVKCLMTKEITRNGNSSTSDETTDTNKKNTQ